jgi:predicted nucleotidyltransferase
MFPEMNAVVRYILNHPTSKTHLREIARQTNYSPAGARKALKNLLKLGFVTETPGRAITLYAANTKSPLWLPLKRTTNMLSLYDAGLIEQLVDEYEEPQAIILFGSYARGDDTEKSDIDIAIVTDNEHEPDLTIQEKRLGHKINIITFQPKTAEKEFLNNIANGTVLHGYLQLL